VLLDTAFCDDYILDNSSLTFFDFNFIVHSIDSDIIVLPSVVEGIPQRVECCHHS
jgi:hypothetical protein